MPSRLGDEADGISTTIDLLTPDLSAAVGYIVQLPLRPESLKNHEPP